MPRESADEIIVAGTSSAATPSPMVRLAGKLRSQDWLALMLLGLHAALMLGLETWVAKGFLMFHFGSFLLWQPIVRGEQKLYWGQAVLVVALATALVAIPSLWLFTLWIALLLGLIGGQASALKKGTGRRVALCAGAYLLSMLLIWVVPQLLQPLAFPDLALQLIRFVPLVLIAAVCIMRVSPSDSPGQRTAIDLLYSMLLFFMVIVLVLGAFVINQVNNTRYVLALAQTLLVIAAILLALSWMWDPRAGFGGLGNLLTRYVLSVGTPFEDWMRRLADISQSEREPYRFLELAAEEMVHLPWISGIEWSVDNNHGSVGHIAQFSSDCSVGAVKLHVYTRWFAGPSMVLHMRLLTRLLADYYEAKLREQEQRNNAYMHAIYETGTRLTHDVKNLLQSLRSLCSAADMSGEADAAALRALVQRQLPQITQRLQTTLDKLARKNVGQVAWIPAADWWTAIQQRYARMPLTFQRGQVPQEAVIPGELFDSVAENLIQNAQAKQQVKRDLSVSVTLDFDQGACLKVTDDGAPVPDHVKRHLFAGPVMSSRGLGIGLYQAARQAKDLGFSLALDQSYTQGVRFVLKAVPSEKHPETGATDQALDVSALGRL